MRIQEWVSHGIISSEQAQEIEAYESSQEAHPWVQRSFLLLGTIVIGIGIIALCAANWELIPDSLKLFIDFLMLMALATCIFITQRQNNLFLSESLLVLFVIMSLASIGLISQIYHSGGEFYEAILFWCFITSGVMAVSRHFLLPFLWSTGLLYGSMHAAHELPITWQSVGLVTTFPLLTALACFFCMYIAPKSLPHLKAFSALAFLSGLGVVIVMEMTQEPHTTVFMEDIYKILGLIYSLSLLLTAIICAIPRYSRIQKSLLTLLIALYLAVSHLFLFEVEIDLVYATLFLFMLFTLAMFFASHKKRALFQCCLIVLGLRFLVLCFQQLGGLVHTGIGLIVTGLVIMVFASIWYKYNDKIASLAEGWAE